MAIFQKAHISTLARLAIFVALSVSMMPVEA
jgi:hypothetical protein